MDNSYLHRYSIFNQKRDRNAASPVVVSLMDILYPEVGILFQFTHDVPLTSRERSVTIVSI